MGGRPRAMNSMPNVSELTRNQAASSPRHCVRANHVTANPGLALRTPVEIDPFMH